MCQEVLARIGVDSIVQLPAVALSYCVMGEKGTEKLRSVGGLVGLKKEHVRQMKNGHGQACLNFIPIVPVAVRGSGSDTSAAEGSSKKGKRLNEYSALSMSPNSRRGGSPGGSYSPKTGSPRTSPSLGCHYAGAKFSEPPSPDSLPKPPMHWTGLCSSPGMGKYMEISQQLKMALKVQA